MLTRLCCVCKKVLGYVEAPGPDSETHGFCRYDELVQLVQNGLASADETKELLRQAIGRRTLAFYWAGLSFKGAVACAAESISVEGLCSKRW